MKVLAIADKKPQWLNKLLKDWLVFYNNKRKHWGIRLLTPMQKYEKLLEKQLVCL